MACFEIVERLNFSSPTYGVDCGFKPQKMASESNGGVWVGGQVSVAVLLDNFVSASIRMQEEERQRELSETKGRRTIRSTLDPLLERLARDFVDDADLSARLHGLFQVSFVQFYSEPIKHPRSVVSLWFKGNACCQIGGLFSQQSPVVALCHLHCLTPVGGPWHSFYWIVVQIMLKCFYLSHSLLIPPPTQEKEKMGTIAGSGQ